MMTLNDYKEQFYRYNVIAKSYVRENPNFTYNSAEMHYPGGLDHENMLAIPRITGEISNLKLNCSFTYEKDITSEIEGKLLFVEQVFAHPWLRFRLTMDDFPADKVRIFKIIREKRSLLNSFKSLIGLGCGHKWSNNDLLSSDYFYSINTGSSFEYLRKEQRLDELISCIETLNQSQFKLFRMGSKEMIFDFAIDSDSDYTVKKIDLYLGFIQKFLDKIHLSEI